MAEVNIPVKTEEVSLSSVRMSGGQLRMDRSDRTYSSFTELARKPEEKWLTETKTEKKTTEMPDLAAKRVSRRMNHCMTWVRIQAA